MIEAKTKAEARAAIAEARARGNGPIALVPTMGALHEGHLSLVDIAREHAAFVVLSVYVNPLQFGPAEDLARYPRDVERDARLAAERGVDLLFAPTDAEMYLAGEPIVRVSPGPLGDRLCGAFRPGHFVGVLTVVAKLFNIVQPDVAVFGQKDYQQAVLIRRMAVDLDMPIEIVVAPLVREPDGLAMSSRNAYLTGDARERARSLYDGLTAAANAYRNGERSAARLAELVRTAIEGAGGRTQYVELVAPDTLAPLEVAVPGSVLAVAAFVDGTRLIDNIVLT